MTSEGNLRNLKWRLRTLGQAGRLSERMRVAPRLFLFLVRSRDFFSFSISWSGTWKYPPFPQNTSSKYSLISEVSQQEVSELYSRTIPKISPSPAYPRAILSHQRRTRESPHMFSLLSPSDWPSTYSSPGRVLFPLL